MKLLKSFSEKLQQLFNKQIFQLEQNEYEKEGISWSKVSYVDNEDCLQLIEVSDFFNLSRGYFNGDR